MFIQNGSRAIQPHVQVLSSCRLALLPMAHAPSSTLFPNRHCKLVCAVLCTFKLSLGAYCLGAQRLRSHLNTRCVDGNYFNINKNPTRCNSMQIFIYSKSLYMFRVSTAPIIRSTKNCNRSFRYRPYCKIQGLTEIN